MGLYNFVNLMVLATAVGGAVCTMIAGTGVWPDCNKELFGYIGGWSLGFMFLSMIMALVGAITKIENPQIFFREKPKG